MPDLYDLSLLHDTGPAPRGLDDRHEVPAARATQLRELARERGAPVRVVDHQARPSESQSWGAEAAMWGLGLAAGLCVVGLVVQMVTGGRW